MNYLKKYESTNSPLTWEKIINDPDVDFIRTDIDDIESLLNRRKIDVKSTIDLEERDEYYGRVWRKYGGERYHNNIEAYYNIELEIILLFKNQELFAVISCYDSIKFVVYKDIALIVDTEKILLYDFDDVKYKIIYN